MTFAIYVADGRTSRRIIVTAANEQAARAKIKDEVILIAYPVTLHN